MERFRDLAAFEEWFESKDFRRFPSVALGRLVPRFINIQSYRLGNRTFFHRACLLLVPRRGDLILRVVRTVVLYTFVGREVGNVKCRDKLLLPVRSGSALCGVFNGVFERGATDCERRAEVRGVGGGAGLHLISFLCFVCVCEGYLRLRVRSGIGECGTGLFFRLLRAFRFLYFRRLVSAAGVFFCLFVPGFVRFHRWSIRGIAVVECGGRYAIGIRRDLFRSVFNFRVRIVNELVWGRRVRQFWR